MYLYGYGFVGVLPFLPHYLVMVGNGWCLMWGILVLFPLCLLAPQLFFLIKSLGSNGFWQLEEVYEEEQGVMDQSGVWVRLQSASDEDGK